MCGFHQSRYFHEATQLNSLAGGLHQLPQSELDALCASPDVSFAC